MLMMVVTLTLSLLIIKFQIIQSGAKIFKTFNTDPSNFIVSSVSQPHKSENLCRNACILAETDCKAYSFNKTSLECEFGTIVSDDLIKLNYGFGKLIHYEDLPDNQPSNKFPHVAVIGRNGGTESCDFSLADDTVSTAPWFPLSPGGNVGRSVGFYYDNGFFVCGGSNQPTVCQHLALGSDEWISMPSMPNHRSYAGYVALGKNTLWVLGGEDASSNTQSTTDTFFNNKWYEGPKLPALAPTVRQCVAKISSTEVLVAGGKDKNKANTKAAFIYDLMQDIWTKIDDHTYEARYNFACALHTLSTGEKRVFIV